MSNEPRFTNECYECGHNWLSWDANELCPECKEFENVGTDTIKDKT